MESLNQNHSKNGLQPQAQESNNPNEQRKKTDTQMTAESKVDGNNKIKDQKDFQPQIMIKRHTLNQGPKKSDGQQKSQQIKSIVSSQLKQISSQSNFFFPLTTVSSNMSILQSNSSLTSNHNHKKNSNDQYGAISGGLFSSTLQMLTQNKNDRELSGGKVDAKNIQAYSKNSKLLRNNADYQGSNFTSLKSLTTKNAFSSLNSRGQSQLFNNQDRRRQIQVTDEDQDSQDVRSLKGIIKSRASTQQRSHSRQEQEESLPKLPTGQDDTQKLESVSNLDFMIASRPQTKHESQRMTQVASTRQKLKTAQGGSTNMRIREHNRSSSVHNGEKLSQQNIDAQEEMEPSHQIESNRDQMTLHMPYSASSHARSIFNKQAHCTGQLRQKYQHSQHKEPITEFNFVPKRSKYSESGWVGGGDNMGVDSAKVMMQLEMPVESEGTLKSLKEFFTRCIGEYSIVVKDYLSKIASLGQLLNKIEFEQNYRSVQDLQELFKYCRDKITLTEKHIEVEQQYYQFKRQIELKNVELSQLKSKCSKQEHTLKTLHDENRDLRKQVLAGIEERTAMFKMSQSEQTKISSMQLKVDGLEQGLLTLCADVQTIPTTFSPKAQPTSSNQITLIANKDINVNINSNNNNNNINTTNNNSKQAAKSGVGALISESVRQNRLKTTIHVLIMENNTLKKELSYMKNQHDDQIEEINRLKKKINHLVMKIDEQGRKYSSLQAVKSQGGGMMEFMSLKEQEDLFIEQQNQNQELENSGLEEFEKLKDKLTTRDDMALEGELEDVVKPLNSHASPILVSQKYLPSPLPSNQLEINSAPNLKLNQHHSHPSNPTHQSMQSLQSHPSSSSSPRKHMTSFNLQGPYWKNRTNDILRQDRQRDKRSKVLNKYDSVDQFRVLEAGVPSLLTREGRDRRQAYDFRFQFLDSKDDENILSEINQMGIRNYIETTMSLKSMEIKKNIELVTKEYVVNNTLRRVFELTSGVMFEYFLANKGDLSSLIIAVNAGLCKILEAKEVRIWVRDVMNNYLYTYDQHSNYLHIDLSHSSLGQTLTNAKEPMYIKFPHVDSQAQTQAQRERKIAEFMISQGQDGAIVQEEEETSLLVPLFNPVLDINQGVVQLVQADEHLTNVSDLNIIQYIGQIASTIVSEAMTALLVREQQSRVQYYYLGKQNQVQVGLINLLRQTSKLSLFQTFEKEIKSALELTRVKFAFLKDSQTLWHFIPADSKHTASQPTLYQELKIDDNHSLMQLTLQKNQALVFFMAYQNLDFDSRFDMDTSLPLNSIPLKSASGSTIGVVQFENKQVRNRNKVYAIERDTRQEDQETNTVDDKKLPRPSISTQMMTSLNDEGILNIIKQISTIMEVCLSNISDAV